MNTIMQVRGLTFKNDKRRWFRQGEGFTLGPIELNVQRGETIAIIGENRSGKSLLAKLLVGAINAHAGEIILNSTTYSSERQKKMKPSERTSDIRMMFQHSGQSLNPALTVGKILDEPLRLNTDLTIDQRQRVVEDTLVKVGLLREHYYFYQHMLSDGQQQRVSLARSIMLEPKVLVADEPFAALDPSIRSQTVNLILKLQQELGLAFIFISHNLGIVRHIADKIIVMQDGQIVEAGKTDTLFKWPQHPVTKKLILAYQSLIPQQTIV